MADLLRLRAPKQPQASATWHLPPSKSTANRALVLAAQATQPVDVHPVAAADDVRVVARFLERIHRLHRTEKGYKVAASVQGSGVYEVDVGLAGSAARFLTALCCVLPGRFQVHGATRLHERPIYPLVEALKSAGAAIDYMEKQGHLPLRIHGAIGCLISPLRLQAKLSSQFLSAVLLLGPSLPLGFEVILDGQVASETYVALTREVCKAFGTQWDKTEKGYRLATKKTAPSSFAIESDWSNASYALAFGCLSKGLVTLAGLTPTSAQGDSAQLAIWQQWGGVFTWSDAGLLADFSNARVAAFDLDFSAMPDLAQTFAVLATQAVSKCLLRGLHTLRHKETDRIAAMETELAALGVRTETEGDTLTVHPGPVTQKCPLRTYNDHRMAMAFAPLCHVLAEGLLVENPTVVSKSFPAFWEQLAANAYRLVRV